MGVFGDKVTWLAEVARVADANAVALSIVIEFGPGLGATSHGLDHCGHTTLCVESLGREIAATIGVANQLTRGIVAEVLDQVGRIGRQDPGQAQQVSLARVGGQCIEYGLAHGALAVTAGVVDVEGAVAICIGCGGDLGTGGLVDHIVGEHGATRNHVRRGCDAIQVIIGQGRQAIIGIGGQGQVGAR